MFYLIFYFLYISVVTHDVGANEISATSPAPDSCLVEVSHVGLPAHDPQTETIRLCWITHALAYSAQSRLAAWVAEDLRVEMLTGPANRRTERFRVDPDLPHRISAQLADYKDSGFDRGHLAPAADFKFNQKQMSLTFRLSNVAPQIGNGFNRGVWRRLETATRAWVSARRQLYVFTGPVIEPNGTTIGKGRIPVPVAFFKIVYDPESRIALSFLLPHRKMASHTWPDHQVRVDDVERVTNLDFFPNLEEQEERQMEATKPLVWK